MQKNPAHWIQSQGFKIGYCQTIPVVGKWLEYNTVKTGYIYRKYEYIWETVRRDQELIPHRVHGGWRWRYVQTQHDMPLLSITWLISIFQWYQIYEYNLTLDIYDVMTGSGNKIIPEHGIREIDLLGRNCSSGYYVKKQKLYNQSK